MVSFWDREELIDMGDLAPEFHVMLPSFQHPRDEWNGLINLPSEFRVQPSTIVKELEANPVITKSQK
jgi:hypothetical protein